MNTAPNQETPQNGKLRKVIVNILCIVIGLAVIVGVKSCIKNMGMPDDLKEAKAFLKSEGFSVRYVDGKGDVKDFLEDIDISADGVSDLLVASNQRSEDLFMVAYCDDVTSAQDLEFDLSWELAKDDYLYQRGYSVKTKYRTVYFGHIDVISELTD